MRARHPYLLIAGVALAASLAAQAEVYRWVDENGVTHYSAQRPPSGDYEKVRIDAKPAPADAGQRRAAEQDAFNQRLEARDKAQAEAAEARRQAAERQQRCAQARERISYLENTPPIRLFVPSADGGEPARMTEDDHARRLAEARERASEACN